jgi:flagellar motility protein MotE (MotC chaperone)
MEHATARRNAPRGALKGPDMKTPARRNATTRSDVRLLPAVAGVAAILLGLKAGGLAFDASAATAPAPAQKAAAAQPTTPPAATPPPPAAAVPNGTADPLAAINSALPMPANRPPLSASQTAQTPAAAAAAAAPASDSGVSQAEMDVLTSLAGRRGALEDRQRELDLKASVIAAAEKRVDEKIAQLKALQTQIEALMGQREARETQQLDGLVRVYSAMKPRDAARIFSSLDGDVRINVAGRMKADAMAGILAALPSDVAQKLTVELATRYRAPASAAALGAAPPAQQAAQPAAPMP